MSLTCFPRFDASEGAKGPLDTPRDPSDYNTRILLLREGPFEEVGRHPDVAPLLRDGWAIDSVYVLGPEEVKRRLLVLLHQPAPR